MELYIPDNKELFQQLQIRQSEIEKDLGEPLVWMALPEKKASRAKVMMLGDVEEKAHWQSYFEWLLREAEKFRSVFPKYIKDALATTTGALGGD